MKRILTAILGISLLGIISINNNYSKAIEFDGVFEKVNSKVQSISSSDNIEEVNYGFLITNSKQITYIYENVKVLEIKEEYFCHITDNENLYLVSKNDEGFVLSKVNKKTKKISKLLLEITNPVDMEIVNEELIIVGSDDSNAVIYKYDKDLNYLHSYYYGGKGRESFIKIYSLLGDYYLIGIKDAISENSPFLNVGNSGERKVFLTKINGQGIIIDTVYFNHQGENEELFSSDLRNDIIVVNIKSEDTNYIYYLNSELQTINYLEQINQGKTLGIMSYTNDYLVVQEGISLSLIVNDEVYDLETKGFLKKVLMDDNVLKIYYYRDYYLWEMVVYEYQIIHKEDIIINRLDAEFNEKMDMNDLSEIKIKSFIHALDLQLESINPLLNKQVHGSYQATFKVVINKNKWYYLDNKIIVQDYINIYDNHTYPVGYSLKFTGYALLDDKSIASGYKVNEEGVHNLVVTDVFGNKNKYTFRIINSDYCTQKGDDLDYMKPSYIINKNQEVRIKIITNKPVLGIYINDEIAEFKNIDGGVIVKLSGFEQAGMHQININKIEYVDEVYLVNKCILVNVLKDAPSVEIKEVDDEDLVLKLNIFDLDQSFENLKFMVYDGETIVDEYYFDYVKNSISIGNIPKDKIYKIKGFLLYDIGNGIINEVSFFEFLVNTELDDYQIMSWDISEEGVDIKFHTNNSNLQINNLKIGVEELNSKYQVVNNYTPLYVSIILSSIVLIFGGFYCFYKRRNGRKS